LQEITLKIGNDNEKEKMVKIRNPWGKGKKDKKKKERKKNKKEPKKIDRDLVQLVVL